MKKIFLSIFVFSFVVAIPVQSIFAADFGRLGIRPAFPREDNPRSEAIFIHELEPGAEQEDGVLLVNNTNETKEVLIYATDHAIASGGTFTCKQYLEEKNNVGSWIDVEGEEYTLLPDTSEVVDFSIIVPENAGVGEHNGCIVLQEKKDESERHPGVNLSLRTALRVAIKVPGDINKSLEITGFATEEKEENKNVFLKPEVTNTGNTSIDTQVNVRAYTIFGKEVASFGGEFPILREQTSEYNFEMERTYWGGFYTAQFTVDYDRNPDNILGQETDVEMVNLQSETIRFFLMPSLVGLVIYSVIAALLVLFILLIALRIKRARWIKTTWKSYKLKKDDDIKSIAKAHNVSWRLLAKVNKIRAPYSLNGIASLRVPSKIQKKK